jgi:hypothetical protein
VFRNADSKAFTGILKLLFYFNFHKPDYSPDEYRLTRELFMNMLCEYLVNE